MTQPKPSLRQRALRVIGCSGLPGSRSLVSRLGGLSIQTSQEFVVDFDSLRYTGCFGEYVDRHIWCFGAYSLAELDLLSFAATVIRARKQQVIYLDIGANVGQHALFMARRVSRVLAFEPNPQVARRMGRNRDANALRNLEIHPVALGLEDGEATLGSGLPANSGSRSLAWSIDPSQDTRVVVRHAGRYLEDKALGVERVDIIKLDVEGFEKNILTGMHSILLRDRPVILFELVGKEVKGGFQSEADLRAALYSDHQLFSVVGSRHARIEPFSWHNGEEALCLPAELAGDFSRLMA